MLLTNWSLVRLQPSDAVNINFSIGVGVAVPTLVTFAPLPPTILSLNPSWQAYYYFVYQEEFVIVDPVTRQIIAVIRV